MIRRDLSELALKRPSAGRREGEEKEQQNTHVEALRDLLTDAGSTPAGSMKKAPVTFWLRGAFFMSPAARLTLASPAVTTRLFASRLDAVVQLRGHMCDVDSVDPQQLPDLSVLVLRQSAQKMQAVHLLTTVLRGKVDRSA